MAATKSIIVLAPNGRRQTVKVTPNHTILQVLIENTIEIFVFMDTFYI